MDSIQSDKMDISPVSSFYWYDIIQTDGESDLLNPTSTYSRFIDEGEKLSILPTWSEAVIKGVCKDKGDYYSCLREICLMWSRNKLQKYNSSEEVRLVKLMLILRETDHMISRLSEQIIYWYSMRDCDSDSLVQHKKGVDPIREMASGTGNDGISLLCRDLVSMKESRSRLVRDISTRCEILLPNSSTIVGPLVAARLLLEAGNLDRLCRMPSSKIQVLGARNALFSHLSSGSPSPKHGLIFEHKRIHAASRRIRGKVARTLAANLAIAFRIDYYRGVKDSIFLERARLRIEKAGRKI
jgi:nucleolar protein 56